MLKESSLRASRVAARQDNERSEASVHSHIEYNDNSPGHSLNFWCSKSLHSCPHVARFPVCSKAFGRDDLIPL